MGLFGIARGGARGWTPRQAQCALVGAALVALAGIPASAETAWVKDEVRINLRTGPGREYRIIGVLKTGDSLEVLRRGGEWIQVRAPGMDEGWIPEGYLQSQAPARAALAQRVDEVATLRERVEELAAETEQLRASNDELSERDGAQASKIQALTRENLAFRAGVRYQEWFAGAAILAAGMVAGFFLSRIGRRRAPRVRL